MLASVAEFPVETTHVYIVPDDDASLGMDPQLGNGTPAFGYSITC